MAKNIKEIDDFLLKYALLSQGQEGKKWCRYFPYLPANTNHKMKMTQDYELTEGEYIICKYLAEIIKELRKK